LLKLFRTSYPCGVAAGLRQQRGGQARHHGCCKYEHTNVCLCAFHNVVMLRLLLLLLLLLQG
jgi:hypothetical protein